MYRPLLAYLVVVLVSTAQAEEIVLGMSQDQVAITATFDGSNILVFGAIKREQEIPKTPLHVIVSISGPATPVIVRRKEHFFGIWANINSFPQSLGPKFLTLGKIFCCKNFLFDI